MQKVIFSLIFIFNVTCSLIAGNILINDTSYSKTGYWFGLGLGRNYFGPTICANLSFTVDQNVFTIKYAKSDEFQFNVEGHYDEPATTLKEYGILYGRYLRKNILLLSISAGISYLKGTDRGKNIEYKRYENVHVSTVGLPVEIEATFELSNYLGIGVLFFGNLNSKKTFEGGMLRLKIGSF